MIRFLFITAIYFGFISADAKNMLASGNQPYLSSLILRDAESGSIIGTASHICVGLNQTSLYFLTPAHVVEGVKKITGSPTSRGAGRELEKIAVNSEMDLALLQAPTTYVDLMLPCYSFPPLLMSEDTQFREAFDILAVDGPIDYYPLDIEGYDSQLDALRTERVITPVVSSVQSGLPGRDDTGPLLMALFKARPGFSGGLVLYYPEAGPIAEDAPSFDKISRSFLGGEPLKNNRRFILGMVTAAEPIHNRVAIIPSTTIRDWVHSSLDRYYQGRGSKESQISALGGIFNRYLNVYIKRPIDTFNSVGLSSFGGVGTGRPAVGSPQQSSQNSAIIFGNKNNHEWLSIGEKWVEGDPISKTVRESFKKGPSNIEGFYFDMNQQQIRRTSEAPFPKIFNVEDIARILDQKDSTCTRIQLKEAYSNKKVYADICDTIGKADAVYTLKSPLVNLKVEVKAQPGGLVEINSSINSKSIPQGMSFRRYSDPKFNIKIEGLSGLEILDKERNETWIGPLK